MTNADKNLTLPDFNIPMWPEVKEVWNHGLLGVDIGSIVIALVIFCGFLILREFLAKFILRRLGGWAANTPNKLDDGLITVMMPPAQFIPIILGIFFAGEYLNFEGEQALFFGRILRSLIAFTIFWSLYLAAEPLSHSMKKLERMLTPMMMQWIFKVMKILLLFIGGAVIMEIWGIKVAPLLAGLGLFGAAVALGAQDFFKNLIAGMSLISEKRFLAGDWILVDGVVEGTVEEIGFRSTKIRRFDRAPIYVPNSKLSDAVVTNFSRMTHRRIKWTIGVSYKTTVKQLKTIRDEILKYLEEKSERFAPKEEIQPTVRVDAFGESSIDFQITCFTRTTNHAEWMEIKEKLAFKIKEIVEEKAKASFAAPSRVVALDNTPTEKSEIFTPPNIEKK